MPTTWIMQHALPGVSLPAGCMVLQAFEVRVVFLFSWIGQRL